MCEECKKAQFASVMSAAKQCGHSVGRSGQQWCAACAKQKDVCRACGKNLATPAKE